MPTFIDAIFSLVWDIQGFFFGLYRDSKDIPIVGHFISEWFYSVYIAIWNLLTPIAHFYDWAVDIQDRVQGVLTFESIWDYFRDWFKWAEWSWQWIDDAWLYVTNWINEWWSTAQQEVLVWVNDVRLFAQSLIANVEIWLGSLQESWDNFQTLTLPNLATWTGIQGLIDTTLRTWFPFYNNLVNLWSTIEEFFIDPQQYVYSKLDEFFERFW